MQRVNPHTRKNTFVRGYERKKLTKTGKSMVDSKVHKVMHEFKYKTLHSYGGRGKVGKLVTERPQAIAIALSEASRIKGLNKFVSKKFKR